MTDPKETLEDENKIDTVIADDIAFKGSLKFKNSLKIKGSFEGRIETDGQLIVGREAKVSADVKASEVNISGVFSGKIKALKIALNKNLEIAYSNLGGVLFNLGKYDEAIEYFSKSIMLSAAKSESYMFRGVSYFNIHRTDLACKDWMQAKKLGSANVDPYIAGYCK